MFYVHVDLKVDLKSIADLEQIYKQDFVSAISAQPGFVAVDLLRPYEGGGDFRLAIAFENRDLQQKWVATDIHQQLWSRIESCCASYTVSSFQSI